MARSGARTRRPRSSTSSRRRPPAFGSGSTAPHLARELRPRGTLLTDRSLGGHVSRYAKPGGTDATELGPYALLRTFEDLLGYKALARAKEAPSLSSTVLATARVVEPGDD
ncbi:MAG: hypothetical protein ACSLFR_01840 [Solirubrobacteraceae bacterium]